MVAAGWFLYSKWDLNNQVFNQLNDTSEQLKRLAQQNPHPGNAKIDNIKAAKDQVQGLHEYIQKTRAYFHRIPPIPDEPKISDMSFSTALSRTLNQLQRDATNSSVTLPTEYAFSFDAQRRALSFAAGSLQPLSVQLGEVKAIADVLFQAKVNSLERIRRERVSGDDANGSQSDYLIEKSTTNELAVMTPYELTFNCFSTELAAVLSGFASSANGIIVKNFNVEPAPAPSPESTSVVQAPQEQQIYRPPPRPSQVDMDRAMRERYGLSGPRPDAGDRYGGGGSSLGGIPLRSYTPAYQPQAVAPAAQPAGPVGRGGLNTVLDERLLKITMNLVVVKLK
jgi:hypothetical protein